MGKYNSLQLTSEWSNFLKEFILRLHVNSWNQNVHNTRLDCRTDMSGVFVNMSPYSSRTCMVQITCIVMPTKPHTFFLQYFLL